MTQTQTVAQVIAQDLVRHGVSTVFAQSLPSAIVLAAENLGIKAFAYRTENAGAAMADGFARTSNRVGVVMAQNGPAATLLVPGLAEAMKTSIPVIAIVQDIDRKQTDRNAFQEYDHVELFQSCTKWVRRVTEASRISDYIDMAFTAVFLVLLRGMWKGVRPCRPWLVSLLTAALVYKLVPGAWYVAAGAVSGLICAALLAPRS